MRHYRPELMPRDMLFPRVNGRYAADSNDGINTYFPSEREALQAIVNLILAGKWQLPLEKVKKRKKK